MNNVLEFKIGYRRTREMDLWDRYLWALSKVQDEYPVFTADTMRAAVKAHDEWLVEYNRRSAS